MPAAFTLQSLAMTAVCERASHYAPHRFFGSKARITADLAARDARDANRAVAPLKSVPEAGGFFLETTTRSIDESVAAVLRAHLDRLQP